MVLKALFRQMLRYRCSFLKVILGPARLASSAAYISLSCFCRECSPVALRFGQSVGSHSRMEHRAVTVDALVWEHGLAPYLR